MLEVKKIEQNSSVKLFRILEELTFLYLMLQQIL